MRSGFVYILTNRRNGTLYIGVTGNLVECIRQHKEGHGSDFTGKYGLSILVWFETFAFASDAIPRETSLKRWPCKWKLALIEKTNPYWRDLFWDLV